MLTPDHFIPAAKRDQTRAFTKWMAAFLNNMPCAATFEPTDDEADQMWKAFFEGTNTIPDAWSCAARIWEARERVSAITANLIKPDFSSAITTDKLR